MKQEVTFLFSTNMLLLNKWNRINIYVMYISEKYVKNIDMVLLRYQKHPTDALLIYF